MWYNCLMWHRHLVSTEVPSLAAVDDIIDRGGVEDWRELKACAERDKSILDKIIKVCAQRISDPYAQRYHLWNYYARHAIA